MNVGVPSENVRTGAASPTDEKLAAALAGKRARAVKRDNHRGCFRRGLILH